MRLQKWTLRQADQAQVLALARKTELPPLAVRVMAGRGVVTEQALLAFRGAGLPICDPFALQDMDKAVARIRRAIAHKEQIVVYGDYDCDGMMATTMLVRCLESLGGKVRYYIPQREKEGYGLNKDALVCLCQAGVSLVVTVDNGITAIDEIAVAAEMGLDVVVTDHHQPRPQLPEAAVAVVDPHRLDDESGCEMLCGAGVAYKLCCALTGRDMMDEFGDLLALATVADIVPLVGENRTYVQKGLECLKQTKNEGLRCLLKLSGFGQEEKAITSEGIMFGVAPRINCAGRFDQVQDAMDLLSATGEDAKTLAERIDRLNQKRRAVEDEILRDILSQLKAEPQRQQDRVIVVWGEGWWHGVLGIVASRITRQFGKPCILLGMEGDVAKGSGRSVEGFSLIQALMDCDVYLQRYGGHNQAVGLTIEKQQLTSFAAAVNDWAERNHPVMPLPELMLDCQIPAKALTMERFSTLSCLAPFGCGNQTPVFLMRECTLWEVYPISENRHLRLRLTEGGESFWTVYFGVSLEAFPYRKGDVLDLAVQIDVDTWRGEKRLSIKVQDVRPARLDYEQMLHQQGLYERLYRGENLSTAERQAVSPTRQDVETLYAWIRREKTVCRSAPAALLRLGYAGADMGKVLFSFALLEELGLLERQEVVGGERMHCVAAVQKHTLEETPLWKRIWGEDFVAVKSK